MNRLREAGIEVVLWRDIEDFRDVTSRAGIGLSTASWAIAETGSLVLESGPGKGRSVTLLPPTYVAIVPVDRMLRDGAGGHREVRGRQSSGQRMLPHRAEPFGRHRDVAGSGDARARVTYT